MSAARLAAASIGGLAFAFTAHGLGTDTVTLMRLSVFGVAVGALVATDLAERRIPNRIVVPAILICLALSLTERAQLAALAPALAIAALLLVVALVVPRALGMGDAKLSVLVAVALDGAATRALLLGLVLAAVAGLLLIAREGGEARRATLPLAPFLAAGALFAILA